MSRKRKSGSQYTSLQDHKRHKKTLTPPFRQLPQLKLTSWRDTVSPEMLWAVLLSAHLPREDYLKLFRSTAQIASDLGWDAVKGVEHTKLADLPPEVFDDLFAPVMAHALAKDVLRSLLILEGLPDRGHWKRHLFDPDPADAVDRLAAGILAVTDHQSQQATDCRWLRLLLLIVLDRMHFPHEMRDRVEEVLEYPDKGDARAVAGFVRASEMATLGLEEEAAPVWPEAFWRETWERTHCGVPQRRASDALDVRAAIDQFGRIYLEVTKHFIKVTPNTHLDARRDSVFGLVLFALNLAIRSLQGGAHAKADGRMILRTSMEAYVTLAFLMKRDQQLLWEKYRQYGNGQAKLAFLKLYDLEAQDLPSHVTVADLERLSGEDAWQEFTDIELGHWAGMDLRRMSEEAGVKPIYDKMYGWPSGFVHGQWGAVRDSVFDLCLNPLHRFHRVPSIPRLDMPSVAPDLVKLANLMLELLAQAYPPFRKRVRLGASLEEASATPVAGDGDEEQAEGMDFSVVADEPLPE